MNSSFFLNAAASFGRHRLSLNLPLYKCVFSHRGKGSSRFMGTASPSTNSNPSVQVPNKLLAGVEQSLDVLKKNIKNKKGFIIDMDGVLYHANQVLPGVPDFIRWLQKEQKKFLFLTNASDIGLNELVAKILRLTGIRLPPEQFYTSALATAAFLHSQTPNGSAYVVGSSGLINALYSVGFTMNDVNPDYVVVGETKHYDFHMIERAVHHVKNGAKFIGTNRDLMDRVGSGYVPSTGSLVAPIELITNTKAYFVGKPNPLIMNKAMNTLGTNREDTVIIGDRMDTDIIAGLESGIDTILVMSGVTSRDDLKYFAYKPNIILEGVKDLLND